MEGYNNNSKICGILNIGNNCYLNSGLQIIASCNELIDEINKYDSYKYDNYKYNNYKYNKNIVKLLKDAFKELLCVGTYDPREFIKYFCKINTDFTIGTQCCSQTFIRTLIGNINQECIDNKFDLIYNNNQYKYPKSNDNYCKQYEKFIEKLYPESKAQSLFSGITKSESKGKCPHCQEKIEKYSFNYFIDQIIYLDDFKGEHKFSEILNANIGIPSNLIIDCPKCNNEINLKQDTKFIKLPNILIFTLERYHGFHNIVSIIPDKLEMNKYIDKSLNIDNTSYELFAINIRFGSTEDYGHEICQVKRNDRWYEINDRKGVEIKNISHFDSSYGLFYRLKNKNINEININDKNEIIQKENDIIKITNHTKKYQKEEDKKENDNINPINNIDNIEPIKNIDNNREYGIQKIYLCNEVIISIIKKEDKDNFNNILRMLNTKYSELTESKCSESKILEIIEELKNIGTKSEDINKYFDKCNHGELFNYLKSNMIFPQTKLYSKYTIIWKNYFEGWCPKCGHKLYSENYDNNICFDIVLKINKTKCKFQDVLDFNISKNPINGKCTKKFHNINYNKKIFPLKLPDILIFTLNRKTNNGNKIEVYPNETIEIKKYLDKGNKYLTKITYKLIAVNIFKDKKIGYEYNIYINNRWYIIKNDIKTETSKPDYSNSSYALFYKKL